MTAHTAEFFTLDEVNRLKIVQDVVDRRLTTQMAARTAWVSPFVSVGVFFRVLASCICR